MYVSVWKYSATDVIRTKKINIMITDDMMSTNPGQLILEISSGSSEAAIVTYRLLRFLFVQIGNLVLVSLRQFIKNGVELPDQIGNLSLILYRLYSFELIDIAA